MPDVKIVLGPPGTGKTTNLGRVITEYHQQGYKVLVNSLTKAAATEVAGRQLPIPEHCVGTLHSHCLRSQGTNRQEVAQAHIADWNAAEPVYALSGANKKDVDDPLTDDASKTEGDKLLSKWDLCRHTCTEPRETDVKAFGIKWTAWKEDNGYIDFTDMIENAPDYPPHDAEALFLDEAQDYSRLELNKVKAWARWCKTLVITGDPRQALYSWRGAHPEMFFSDDVPDSNKSVLAQSYRIPRQVHKLANRWAKELHKYHPIEYYPREEEGFVKTILGSSKQPEPVVDLAQKLVDDGKSVMILASCGYLLYPTITYLREQGLPFSNPWRIKQGNWNPLGSHRGVSTCERVLSFMRPNGYIYDNPQPWSTSDLLKWIELVDTRGMLVKGAKEKIKTIANNESAVSYTIVDMTMIHEFFKPELHMTISSLMSETAKVDDCIKWLWQNAKMTRKETLKYPLKLLKSGGRDRMVSKPNLFVGTIHSFKGAEADVVFVYPDLSMQGWKELKEGDHDSVIRMFYVGITRAREGVYLCKPASRMTVQL